MVQNYGNKSVEKLTRLIDQPDIKLLDSWKNKPTPEALQRELVRNYFHTAVVGNTSPHIYEPKAPKYDDAIRRERLWLSINTHKPKLLTKAAGFVSADIKMFRSQQSDGSLTNNALEFDMHGSRQDSDHNFSIRIAQARAHPHLGFVFNIGILQATISYNTKANQYEPAASCHLNFPLDELDTLSSTPQLAAEMAAKKLRLVEKMSSTTLPDNIITAETIRSGTVGFSLPTCTTQNLLNNIFGAAGLGFDFSKAEFSNISEFVGQYTNVTNEATDIKLTDGANFSPLVDNQLKVLGELFDATTKYVNVQPRFQLSSTNKNPLLTG